MSIIGIERGFGKEGLDLEGFGKGSIEK